MTALIQAESRVLSSSSSEVGTGLERSFTSTSFSGKLGRECYEAYSTNKCMGVSDDKKIKYEGTPYD